MKRITLLLTCTSVTLATPSHGSIPNWHPAGPGDLRSSCPGLNNAANHFFLPHDGKNITLEAIIKGLGDAYNVAPELSASLFKGAVRTNPEPGATYFTLDNLNRHGFIEHDASLTRADVHWGNNHVFNATYFAQTRSYWTEDIVTPEHMIHARFARELDSATHNPTYNFSKRIEQGAFEEAAAPLIVLGDKRSGETRREWLEMFFVKEKLPYELGWRRKEVPLVASDLSDMVELLANISTLYTE